MFVTAALPLISSSYGDRFDTYSIGERWFMCLMISAPIIVFGGLLKRLGKRRQAGEFDDVRMGPIGRFFLRRESIIDGDEEKEEEGEHTPTTSSFYLPNLDFAWTFLGTTLTRKCSSTENRAEELGPFTSTHRLALLILERI